MTDLDVAHHPVVSAVRRLAAELLEPQAADVDANGVPRTHVAALGAAGVFGLAAPSEAGGSNATPAVFRAVAEELAGADGTTWFLQAQHHAPVRMLAANPSAASERYLTRLAGGESLAGIAFAHLRRFPQRPVTASRLSNAWRLDGVVPWYTGWGINDIAFIGGLSDDEQVVFAVVPAREQPGVSVERIVETAAMSGARTVMLRLENLVVPDADIALVQPYQTWSATDQVANANANPAIFGVALSAARLLAEIGNARSEPASVAAAAALEEWLLDVRARCYDLNDTAAAGERIDDRLTLRAEALEAAVATTSALVAANAGAGMAAGSPAQRKAREALFLMVQAQTAAARAAILQRWDASARSRSSVVAP